VVTAADPANTIRDWLNANGAAPYVGAALDALLAQAENPDAAWQLALDNEKAYAIHRAEAAEAERDTAVRERDQAHAALQQIADYEWHPGQPSVGLRAIARAALAAREEAWTHEDRMVLGDGGC
jgi:hypothetical protein